MQHKFTNTPPIENSLPTKVEQTYIIIEGGELDPSKKAITENPIYNAKSTVYIRPKSPKDAVLQILNLDKKRFNHKTIFIFFMHGSKQQQNSNTPETHGVCINEKSYPTYKLIKYMQEHLGNDLNQKPFMQHIRVFACFAQLLHKDLPPNITSCITHGPNKITRIYENASTATALTANEPYFPSFIMSAQIFTLAVKKPKNPTNKANYRLTLYPPEGAISQAQLKQFLHLQFDRYIAFLQQHPHAITKDQLEKLKGYKKDIPQYLATYQRSHMRDAAIHNYADIVYDYVNKYKISPHIIGPYELNMLHLACYTDNLQLIQFLLTPNNINIQDCFKKRTALHQACYKGNIEIIRYLIENGAILDIEDNLDNTPLDIIASHGFTNLVLLCLNKIAVMDDDQKYKNALMQAILVSFTQEKYSTSYWIIKHNIDYINNNRQLINLFENPLQNSLLHAAVTVNNIPLVQLLLKTHININKENASKDTALHTACEGGYNLSARLLIEHGASLTAINKRGEYPIDTAFNNQQFLTTRLLLVTLKEKYRYSPISFISIISDFFHNACITGNLEMVKFCLSRIAIPIKEKLLEKKDCGGNSNLHLACKAKTPELIYYLLNEGLNIIEQTHKDKITPIDILFSNQNMQPFHKISVLKFIKKKEPFAAYVTNKPVYHDVFIHAFHSAAKYHEFSIIDFLLSNDMQVFQKNSKQLDAYIDSSKNTALHSACIHAQERLILLLIKANADVNVTNKFGNTPLHFACCTRANISTLTLLVKNGANLSQKNNNGLSPITILSNYRRFNDISKLKEIHTSFEKKQNTNISLDSIYK